MIPVETTWTIVRESGKKYGPYLLLTIMPGGSLLAVALWLYRNRRVLLPQVR